jgi:hypothetical protein
MSGQPPPRVAVDEVAGERGVEGSSSPLRLTIKRMPAPIAHSTASAAELNGRLSDEVPGLVGVIDDGLPRALAGREGALQAHQDELLRSSVVSSQGSPIISRSMQPASILPSRLSSSRSGIQHTLTLHPEATTRFTQKRA